MMFDYVNFHNLKWGASSAWFLLFLCCLLLLWYNRKSWKNGYELFFWLSFGGMLIVYCPLTFKVFIPRLLPGFAEYERLSWVFMAIPLFSYIMIALANRQPTRLKKILFALVCACLLLVMGHPDNRSSYIRPESDYRIPQDAVDAVRIIREETGEENVNVSIQLIGKLNRADDQDPDFRLFYGIRQYESHFRLFGCIVPPSAYDETDYSLKGVLRKKTDYFVGPKDTDCIDPALEKRGYVLIGETKNYRILRNQKRYDARISDGEGTP